MSYKFAFAIIAMSLLLLSAGCTQAPPVTPPDGETPVKDQGGTLNPQIPATSNGTFKAASFDPLSKLNTYQFSSNEELLQFAQAHASQGNYYAYRGGVGITAGAMDSAKAESSSGAAPQAPTASPSAPDYSTTNNQVANVDEADLLKTDGNYIYTISNNLLYIIKATPGASADVVSTLKFEETDAALRIDETDASGSSSGTDGAYPMDMAIRCYDCGYYQSYGYTPRELFVSNNKMAVFGDYSNYKYFQKIDFTPRYGMSFIRVYDVSDAANPKLEKEYKVEGAYFRGRMSGDYAYVFTTSQPEYRDYPTPLVMEGSTKLYMQPTDVFYFNVPYKNPVFLNIHSLGMGGSSHPLSSKSIVTDGNENLYMSEDNAYLAFTEYVDEWDIRQQITMGMMQQKITLTRTDSALVEAIRNADPLVLSKYEKDQKIINVYSPYLSAFSQGQAQEFQDEVEAEVQKKLDGYKYYEFTAINKVQLKGAEISPVANGKVPGHILNQFSMDESGGVLRVATNLQARWSYSGKETTKPTNSIYTLDANLNQMGMLTGIAPDEQIYSTRFAGNRLYMVTFRQVDPFFVFDLSDARNPTELGKLKIPGFSRYLHPYDENTIIGIGQDTNAQGQTSGLKISLFDVADVANPKELAKYVTEEKYASSSALYEHRAFLFSKEKSLLVIPAYNSDGGRWDGIHYIYDQNKYNGAFVFRIDRSQITLRGLIDHSMASGDNYWSPSVQRSLYIGDMLYTKSEKLLRVNALDTLSAVKNVWLNATAGGIKVY